MYITDTAHSLVLISEELMQQDTADHSERPVGLVGNSLVNTPFYTVNIFSNVSIVDSYSLQKEVSQLKAATSSPYPIPTCLFQSCFVSLSPVVLSIINDSVYWCCASSF